MARIRTIKPEMAQDEDLAACSIEAQLLAVRILNHADDEGYFKANPALIKANCFPLLDSLNIHGVLSELSNAGYLMLKKGADGKEYGLVRNFTKHQKINRPTDSKIKELVTFTEHSLNTHGGLTPGKERKGKESSTEDKSSDGAAVESAKQKIWSKGVTLLTKTGQTEKQARSLLGRVVKEIGEIETLTALRLAHDKADPASYLAACALKTHLPTDIHDFRSMRQALGMDPFCDDIETGNREILDHLRANPSDRDKVQIYLDHARAH